MFARKKEVKFIKAVAAALISVVLIGSQAGAQNAYPTKMVKLLVPYVPGGASDTIARLLGEEMRKILGQTFVVENKAGAFGILAIERMARAKADGYTLMLGNVTTNAITPILYADKFSIDYESAVMPVARVATIPNFLVATTRNFAPETVAEVIDYAKKNPGKLRYGSTGIGSFPHFDMMLLAKVAGIDMIHIPTPGGAGKALNDLGNGDVQFGLMNVATGAGMIQAGRIRPLAIVADDRLPQYPDVPTMAEAGFPGIGTLQWQALFAPAGTPPDVIETLHAAVVQALKSERLLKSFEKAIFKAEPTASPEEMRLFVDAEFAKWRRIIAEVDFNFEQ